LLSIGGQDYLSNFATALNSSGPSVFASSIVFNVQNYGFDGVDIDWQYPIDDSQANDMVLLLKAVREALNTYGESLLYNFTLTVACPGPFGYQQLYLAEMDQYVDFWNLMAYDYVGNWSNVTAN
jgi:chitinase